MARIQQEEEVPVRRMCLVLGASRSQYYRRVRGLCDYRKRPERVPGGRIVAERAEQLTRQYVHYGHRKIHALLRREGACVSRYQVYMLLKRKQLLLRSTWRKELRERARALREYLVKPGRPMELLQADITHVPVEGYGTYYVVTVIDYNSKYVLASLFADRHGTDVLIEACNQAQNEAERLGLPRKQEVKLLTDNGPAMVSRRFRRYIAESSMRHLRTRSHHPETKIRFGIETPSEISLSIYDLLGREVTRLKEGQIGRGMHTMRWNAATNPSGVYVVRLTIRSGGKGMTWQKKILLLK